MPGQSRIEYDDIFDPNILKKFIQGFKDAEKQIKASLKRVQKAAKLLKFDTTATKDLTKAMEALTKLTAKQEAESKKLASTQKQLDTATKRLTQVTSKSGKELAQVTDLKRRANAQSKLEAKLQNSAAGSYDHISASMGIAKKRYKELTEAQRKSTAEGKRLDAQIKRQTKSLSRMDKNFGVFGRNVGNYKSALSGFTKVLGTFGVMLGGRAIIQGLGNLIGLGSEFEKQMSKVKAVTGAAGSQMAALSQNAKTLGANTEKTASQVAGLQVELGKLGLTAPEILKVTDAIIDMSTAADADLSQAASTAAKTMKGFGLEAKDMGRIVDVMALSFSSSALDITKFETAMSDVSPTARAFGDSIEESVAKLSILVDSGLDASKSGTSLRNMYLELSKTGLTWNEAMEKIENSTNKNSTALEMFGKRGAVAGLILSENEDAVDALAISYENSAGAAKRMADIMRDNLAGDSDKAKSAMAGLGLTIMDGLNRPIRESVRGFTSFITAINDSMTVVKTQTDLMMDEQAEVVNLISSITSLNEDNEIRASLLSELIANYPDLVGNIDAESVSNNQLVGILQDVNKEYEKRIAISVVQEELAEKTKENTELFTRQRDITRSVNSAYSKYIEVQVEGLTVQEKAKALQDESKISLYKLTEAHRDNNDATGSVDNQVLLNGVTRTGRLLIDEYSDAAVRRTELTKEANELIAESALLTGAVGKKTVVTTPIIIAQTKSIEEQTKAIEAQAKALRLSKGQDEAMTLDIDAGSDESPEIVQVRTDTQYYAEQWMQTYEGRQAQLDIMYENNEIQEGEYTARSLELERDKFAQKMQMYIQYASAVSEIADAVFEAGQIKRDKERDDNSALREYELSLVGDNQAKIDAINKKYDKKEAEAKTKQAKADKKKAIFDSLNRTGIAVMQAATLGPPAMFPFIILAAALGAVNTALIAARPVPQFEKGVKSKPESGYAVVGEGGKTEMLISPSGEVSFTGDQAEMRYLEKGTEVVPNKGLQERLATMSMSDRRLRMYNDRFETGKLEDLQRQQIGVSRQTNDLLGRFRFNEGKSTYNLKGDKITHV